MSDAICQDCLGSGIVTLLTSVKPCRSCRGTGSISPPTATPITGKVMVNADGTRDETIYQMASTTEALAVMFVLLTLREWRMKSGIPSVMFGYPRLNDRFIIVRSNPPAINGAYPLLDAKSITVDLASIFREWVSEFVSMGYDKDSDAAFSLEMYSEKELRKTIK